MGRNGVKVVIRTRPTATFAQNQIQIDQDENTITVNSGEVHSANDGPSNRKDSWKFRYHQVLHNAAQDTVYDAIAHNIVHSAVTDGINGTILAYGQTGAGKTFTMIGDTRNYQYRGVAPRSIAHVFAQVQDRIEIKYTIRVSYMEIYNDRIIDLLADPGSAKQEFVIVEDAKGTTVRGLSLIDVETEQEALDQLFSGELQRTVAQHSLNKKSNRSHSIYTLHISQKSRTGGNERVVHSKLHLVDLAGSERLKKTMVKENADSMIKKESMYINQSLTFLEQCIVALGSKEARHIPYRQTKLTNVLKDSLGGNCNTLMFACIWGESKHLEETISTLKLAQRMMRVQNETASIVETDPHLLLKKYERQIRDLKQELNMHDALVERTGVVYDEHTPEQVHELCKMLRAYVDAPAEGENDILQLSSMQQIRELFRQCKIMIRNAESSGGGGVSQPESSRSGTAPRSTRTPDAKQDKDGSNFVGEAEHSRGFSVGDAPDAARPTSVDTGPFVAESKEESIEGMGELKLQSPESKQNLEKDDLRMTESEKNEAFVFYKASGPGRKTAGSLLDGKTRLRELKERRKELAANVNSKKHTIDEIQTELKSKTDQQDAEVVDEEEFILLKREKEAKREYRILYEELRVVMDDIAQVSDRVDKLKQLLIDEFEDWFKQGGKNETDELDDGEKFDQMEMDRVVAQDPDSLAFFQAQKKMRQQRTSPTHKSRRARR